MSFDELAAGLPAWPDGITANWFFHGCLADCIPGIRSNGLRTQPLEPCLTHNPASALWKYANPASNSRSLYSGRVWVEIEGLVQAGRLIPSSDRHGTLNAARSYWRSNETGGAAFVLDLGDSGWGGAPVGSIRLEDGAVRGAISKWIYGHCAVHLGSSSSQVITVPPGWICGFLKPHPGWNGLFNQLHPLRTTRIKPLAQVRSQAEDLLLNPQAFAWTSPDPGSVERLAEVLVRTAAVGFLMQELRKLFLGLCAAWGYPILKDDHLPVEPWPVSPPDERLFSIEYDDPELRDLFIFWTARLKRFSGEGIP